MFEPVWSLGLRVELLTGIDGLHAMRPRHVAARHHPRGAVGADGDLPAQLVA